MDLRSSLLLIGAIVVVLVALGTYGRARWRRWRDRWSATARTDRASAVAPPTMEEDPKRPFVPVIERKTEDYARIFGASLPGNRPDEHIDFIIHVPLDQPVGRDEVLAIYRQREYDLDRPHAIYGRGEEDGSWSNVERDPADAVYSELALAIQLADAHGAVTDTELNTLASIALEIADEYPGRTLFLDDFDRALERGIRLREFVRAHDVVASIHVLSSSTDGFGGRAIDQAAHRVGMQYGARNIYHFGASHGGAPLYSLAALSPSGEFDLGQMNELRIAGVTLFMMVPCVHHPGDVFGRMATAATTLARVLDGRMLDSDRQPLVPKKLEASRAEVERIADAMVAADIPPGSHAAQRLFGDGMAD